MLNSTSQPTVNRFEELLDTYDTRHLQRGEVVTGTIVYLEEDVAYIDVGAKRDAVVPARDLDSLESELLGALKEGDEIKVYVIHTPYRGGDLVVSIERGLESVDWEQAHQLLESEEIKEYKVVGSNKGGVLVEFSRLTGFVPNSQILEVRRQPRHERDEIKATLIGTRLLLKMIDVDQRRRRLVLSEMAAKDEVRRKRLEELKVGDVVEGRVVSLVPFGAFVDLGGVDGLVHISNLAWKQVDKPDQVVSEGETLEVMVTGVEIERERISLSRKALLPNPWDKFAKEHKEGELLEGVVDSVADFGAFIRLVPGVVGLVHVSEMGDYGQREPKDVFKPGDDVLVRITDIDVDRERVGLSTRKVTREEAFDWMIADTDEVEEQAPAPQSESMEAEEAEAAAPEEPADSETPQIDEANLSETQAEAEVPENAE
ncbi:MAG: 30S ribosomal protein S1 [Anaerolineales bacterium]